MNQFFTVCLICITLCCYGFISYAQSEDSVLGDKVESATQFENPQENPWIEQDADQEITVYVFLLESCVISQYYTLVLNDLHQAYHDMGISFIGYFPNRASTEQTIDSFASRYKIQFPLHPDPDKEYVNRFAATITPEVFVHEGNSDQVLYKGRIDDSYFRVGKKRPKARSHDLKNTLEAIVQGNPIVVSETAAVGCIINMNH